MENKQQEEINSKTSYGIRLGWISIVGNIILFVLKYTAGLLSGSVALIADAWHTLTDSLSSLIVIVGLKISRKPPDIEHPFGHGRAEWISSVLLGVILVIIGINFFKESIERLISVEVVEFGVLAWIATIASILLKEGMAQMCFRGAKKTGLQSLKADAWHHRTDSISSLLVLIGLFFSGKVWWMDGVLGIMVSLLIIYAAYEILKENFNNLLGSKPDSKTLETIYQITRDNCQKDVNLHEIKIHHYGHYQEMTAHIKLPAEMKLETAHNIANSIEDMILAELDIHATIHTEPIDQ